MAKKCQLARESKRISLCARHKEKRDKLRKTQTDQSISEEQRRNARFELNKMPRNSSASRVSRRCQVTGSTRSVYRKFRLNRISFRNMALSGMLPGVTKSSW